MSMTPAEYTEAVRERDEAKAKLAAAEARVRQLAYRTLIGLTNPEQRTRAARHIGDLLRPKFVTASNDPLFGLAARDGVTVNDGDIGLFVGQADPIANGYWEMHDGRATRPFFYAFDFNVADFLGLRVQIADGGTVGGGTSWQQVTGTTLAEPKAFRLVLGESDTVIG